MEERIINKPTNELSSGEEDESTGTEPEPLQEPFDTILKPEGLEVGCGGKMIRLGSSTLTAKELYFLAEKMLKEKPFREFLNLNDYKKSESMVG